MRVPGLLGLALVGIVSSGVHAQPRHDGVADVLAHARATPAERRWRNVPWEASITEALKKARATGKPLFFFGGDGDVDTGNC